MTHETPIQSVVLVVRVHPLRSRRLCGGRAAASRRSRPSAVRLDRSQLLRGRVLSSLSGAWVLRASSTLLAVVAARSVGCSDGGAPDPGRRRFFPVTSLALLEPLDPKVAGANRGLDLRLLPSSTTVSRIIDGPPVRVHTSDKADIGARRGRAAGTAWRSRWAHGAQAAPGAPRGLKSLGRRAGRRKARGSGGERVARSAARKAYATIQRAP